MEMDRLLLRSKNSLNCVTGMLSQCQQGLDAQEVDGLAGLLAVILEWLELSSNRVAEILKRGNLS